MFGRWLSVLLFVAVAMLLRFPSVSEAAAVRAQRNGRNRGSRTRSDPDRPYYWMCPDVVCAPVDSSCSWIEYIVYEYDYEVRGRVVNVRCESCEYCLDGPFQNSGSRRRRHTRSRLNSRRHSRQDPCANVVCPSLPANCVDERLTDVLINGTVCKRCPACFDSTVFNADA